MSGVIATIPKFQFSANGAPMVNGTLETYLAGTSTPTTTWQDQALSIANTNPITLDSRGECVLWLDSTKAYKFILKNAGGVVQWTQDNVSGAASLHGLAASDGSAQIGYTPAGTGAVATDVESALNGLAVSVFRYMTKAQIADVIARTASIDVTVEIQKALDSGFNNIYFPEGLYRYKNLTIQNRRLTLFGDGHWRTVLQCVDPVNTNYGVASAAYVNNSTAGNEPVTIRELTINGNNLVDFPLVIYGYYSEVRNARVVNAKTGGRAIKFTSNGISGSACTSTLVENKLIECTITGGDGDAYIVSDTGAKCTDMMVRGNVFSDGAVTMTTMAGHCVTDNHFYAGAVQFNKLSTGTVISNNYFENEVTLDDFKDEVVGLSGNRFVGRVSVNFGAGGKVCVFDGCLWQGSADLYHNYFAADKRAVVNGGGFETATPVVFHSGTSTGWVSFNNVYNYSTSTFWTGSRQAAVSSIRQVLPFAPVVSSNWGDASATLTWSSSATTNRWTSTLTANRTVTLSTTNAINGARFRIYRTGGGAFTLDVDGLKTLAANQWCEVEYDGSAWVLTAFGSL